MQLGKRQKIIQQIYRKHRQKDGTFNVVAFQRDMVANGLEPDLSRVQAPHLYDDDEPEPG